jgi:putative colanic acid biosynthesis acetyltransferase WcaF
MTRWMSSDVEPDCPPGGEAAPHSVALARFVGQAVFNLIVTHLPGHWLRQLWLRGLGVRIGEGSMIFRGVTVFGADGLRLGCRVQIGFRVVLDARGQITIGDDVNISSDSQLLTARHNPHSAEFERQVAAIVLESNSWVATRALVLAGVTLHRGAILAAGSVASRDVAENTIVAGVPAKPIGDRRSDLSYRLGGRRPPLY